MNLRHFLSHDERYAEHISPRNRFGRRAYVAEMVFTCAGCGKRRSADEGCAGDDLLSQACDYCVVATWASLAAMGRAIALRQSAHDSRPAIRPVRKT